MFIEDASGIPLCKNTAINDGNRWLHHHFQAEGLKVHRRVVGNDLHIPLVVHTEPLTASHGDSDSLRGGAHSPGAKTCGLSVFQIFIQLTQRTCKASNAFANPITGVGRRRCNWRQFGTAWTTCNLLYRVNRLRKRLHVICIRR